MSHTSTSRLWFPLLLALFVASCGGDGNEDRVVVDNDPVVEEPAPESPDDQQPPPSAEAPPDPAPEEPQDPPPGIAPLPVVGTDGIVEWAFGPEQGSLNITVQAFARLPLGSNGRPPRLNAMAYTGNRLFVSDESDAHIYDITSGSPVLFMDVADAVVQATGRRIDRESTWHAGLRSFAFHPDFANNGKLYVSLMEERPSNPQAFRYFSDAANPINADSVVIEFTANPQTFVVDNSSYRQVLRVGMPFYDHTIKQISFNPVAAPGSSDYGLLYIAHGDGSEASATAGGGQRNDALGKIIRINPLASGDQPYSIPDANPFIGNDDWLDELYSVGHRNPHHIAFVAAGELLVAEPGRDNIEELNLVKGGGNFGWPAREGTYVHLQRSGLRVGIEQLPGDDASFGYEYPVVQLGHIGREGATFVRQAIGGGYVAPPNSSLAQQYWYCEFAGTGEIYYSPVSELLAASVRGAPDRLTRASVFKAGVLFDDDRNPATPPRAFGSMLDVVALSPDFSTVEGRRADIRYGRGPQGELYLMSKRNRMVYLITNSKPGE
ncbi:MAG: sorbosone dehydrogenase family protein [Burkholderiaceae bacterium]